MLSTENNTNNKNEEIRKEFESRTIIDTDVVDVEVVNNGDDTHPDAENYRALFEVAHMHEHNMNRFRSVCISGILWTLVFGGCVVYLTKIDYIRFEIGVPALFGIIAILMGFLIGLWRNK